MGESFPAPTFGHATEAFVIAYAAPGEFTVATPPTYVHAAPASAPGHARPP